MINLNNQYTPNVNPPDANYTYGSVRNDSSPVATDGTPLEQALLNDINGFMQSVVVEAGIVPNGNPETVSVSQVKTGLINIITALAAVPLATTSVPGRAELATNTEVQNGTDNQRIVTPAGLASRTATTGRRGIIEQATVGECLAGTDDQRAVPPNGLAAAIAAAIGNGGTPGSGFFDVTGGLRIQYGTNFVASFGATVSFPASFNGSAYVVVATVDSFGHGAGTGGFSSTGFAAYVNAANDGDPISGTIHWIALGETP